MSSSGGQSKASPRKFSEKIALLNKKEAEGNAKFEEIIKEVQATKIANHQQGVGASVSSSLARTRAQSAFARVNQPMKNSNEEIEEVFQSIIKSVGQYEQEIQEQQQRQQQQQQIHQIVDSSCTGQIRSASAGCELTINSTSNYPLVSFDQQQNQYFVPNQSANTNSIANDLTSNNFRSDNSNHNGGELAPFNVLRGKDSNGSEKSSDNSNFWNINQQPQSQQSSGNGEPVLRARVTSLSSTNYSKFTGYGAPDVQYLNNGGQTVVNGNASSLLGPGAGFDANSNKSWQKSSSDSALNAPYHILNGLATSNNFVGSCCTNLINGCQVAPSKLVGEPEQPQRLSSESISGNISQPQQHSAQISQDQHSRGLPLDWSKASEAIGHLTQARVSDAGNMSNDTIRADLPGIRISDIDEEGRLISSCNQTQSVNVPNPLSNLARAGIEYKNCIEATQGIASMNKSDDTSCHVTRNVHHQKFVGRPIGPQPAAQSSSLSTNSVGPMNRSVGATVHWTGPQQYIDNSHDHSTSVSTCAPRVNNLLSNSDCGLQTCQVELIDAETYNDNSNIMRSHSHSSIYYLTKNQNKNLNQGHNIHIKQQYSPNNGSFSHQPPQPMNYQSGAQLLSRDQQQIEYYNDQNNDFNQSQSHFQTINNNQVQSINSSGLSSFPNRSSANNDVASGNYHVIGSLGQTNYHGSTSPMSSSSNLASPQSEQNSPASATDYGEYPLLPSPQVINQLQLNSAEVHQPPQPNATHILGDTTNFKLTSGGSSAQPMIQAFDREQANTIRQQQYGTIDADQQHLLETSFATTSDFSGMQLDEQTCDSSDSFQDSTNYQG